MRYAVASDSVAELKNSSTKAYEEFISIYIDQVLPAGWGFEVMTRFTSERGETVDAWSIRLKYTANEDRKPGFYGYAFLIRHHPKDYLGHKRA